MRKPLYIVDGCRSPFCKFNTLFQDEPAYSLGVSTTKALLAKTGISVDDVDSVIYGCVSQPADTMNISRVIAVRSGISIDTPAVTVHRNCASGMEAITQAIEKASSDQGDVFVVGGVENMSQSPIFYPRSMAKKLMKLAKAKGLIKKIPEVLSFRVSDFSPQVGLKLGLSDILCDMNMGQTAELLAREFEITRARQDAYAVHSNDKAFYSRDKLEEEIVPIHLTNDNCIRSFSDTVVTEDNGPRKDSTIGALGRLRTVFDKRGTVTAANSSQITDGAVSLLLMTKQGLRKTGCEPIGEILDYAYTGCDPSRMGLGPVQAIKKTGIDIGKADLIEINEAFAVQVLACQKLAKTTIGEIPDEILNVNGGSIALGHPVGASGARIVLTLLKELIRREKSQGVAALCVGGGQGGAIWIKT